MIPPLLRRIAAMEGDDWLLSCAGIVYRRDVIDRLHTGEPHQLDLWRIRRSAPLGEGDLADMIARVVEVLAPGRRHVTVAAQHPYTLAGRQIDVELGDRSVEIGECGLAHPAVLAAAGLPPSEWSGLAMGLGLDRLLMLRKGVDDIRLLRSAQPRVREQMVDLSPYRPVSRQPAVRRDMSLAIADDLAPEELGDRVRAALGERASAVELVEILSETPYEALPAQAIERIGMEAGQKNVLVRVVLRDLDKSLTHEEANELRDRIYAALHEGSRGQWACAR
jgi:phenylalanyl-tRNA synthetase alpha chain